MKNKMMKFVLVFLLLCSAMVFSACAQVRAMTITNQDNSIDELVSVSIDPAVILNEGYDISAVKADIENYSLTVAEMMRDNLNQKIEQDKNKATLETREVLESFKNGISVVKSFWENNTFVVGIRFKDMDIYKYYYDIKEKTKIEMQREEHFFYDKVYYFSSTMYVKHNELYNSCNDYFSLKYPQLIESQTNELLYTYKTDLRRQHSDADFITYQEGEYYHTWIVDKENLNAPIMLYYNIANPENYILVSLAASFGMVILLGIISILIKIVKTKTHKLENLGSEEK